MARKFLSALMIVSIVFSLLPTVHVKAAPSPEESKWIIVSKLRGFDEALSTTYSGQYGLYYSLNYLALYAKWVDFLYDFDGTHLIDFSDIEKEFYRQELVNKVKDFNTRFSVESDQYVSLRLSVRENPQEFKVMLENILQDEIPTYVETDLAELLILLDTAESEGTFEYNKALADNKNRLRYLFRIVDCLISSNIEMEAILPEGGTLSIRNNSAAIAIMSNPEYLNLLERGRAIDEQSLTRLDDVNIDVTKEYLENLAYVTRVEGSDSAGLDAWRPTEGRSSSRFELQPTYMRMFAAGAVYRPFVSYVGDKEYIEALKALSGDQADKVIELFNEIKDYRKPLYTIYDASRYIESLDVVRWVTGRARRADGVEEQENSFPRYIGKAKLLSVQDVIDNIEKGTLFGLVMETGQLRQSDTDANVYFYYNKRLQETTLSDGTVVRTNNNSISGSAEEEKTSTTWTPTLFNAGGKSSDLVTYFSATHSLALLRNIIKDNERVINSLGDLSHQYLYMNVFGDIVTKDNLVIIPGVANPKFYTPDAGYVPYTVSFMKHYPNIYVLGNNLKLGSTNSKGKFLLMSTEQREEGRVLYLRIKGENDLATTEPYMGNWVDLDLAEPIGNITRGLTITGVSRNLPGLWNFFENTFSGIINFDEYWQSSGATIVQKENITTASGVDVFNYNPEQDLDFEVAKYLARNMYMSFKKEDGQILEGFNDKIDQDYLFRYVVLEALNGLVYASGYSKSITDTFENITESSATSFKSMIASFTDEIVSALGNVTGVLGIKDSYQDPFFGRFLFYTDKFFVYVLMALLLVFLIKFVKDRASLTNTIVSSAICLCIAFLCLKIVPMYFPKVYNVVVNNFNTKLSYEIVASKAEKYWETYGRSGTTDDDGRFLINTTSINLYKLDDAALKEIEDKYGIRKEDFNAGKVYVLDNNVGLYLEANTLKQNIDLLFYTNPVYGVFEDTPTGISYQIVADKTHSSVVEYYMPYYQIQEGFIDTLNNLLVVYNIPRNSVQYDTGLSKDSFVVYNYLNSAPFLNPRNYDSGEDEMSPDLINSLYYYFDNPDELRDSRDFLNLHRMLSNPTIQMQESLWWKTFVQNGFIDSTTGEFSDRYWNLIESVNLLTKKFLIDLKPQAGLISDENLIKLVSLYATTVFNQKISDYGNWVYPSMLNYQEFNLHDVLLGIVSTDYSKYVLVNRGLVDYVADESGVFALLMLIIIITTGSLISYIVQFSLPVFYICFLLLMLVRFFRGDALKPLLSGYSKVFVLIMLCMTVFVGSLHMVDDWNIYLAFSTLCIVFLAILFVIFHIVSSVLFNFTEMGNTKLTEKIKMFMDKTKLSSVVDKLKVTTTNLVRSQGAISTDTTSSRYRHEVNIDEEVYNTANDLTYLERTGVRTGRQQKGRRYRFDDDMKLVEELHGKDV
jgi:hypothetical protein